MIAMASTKEDGTATAAEQQLGAMSLGESVERNETNEDDTNGTPTKKCSACGKESDTLMKCRDCKCVWYCDAACQKRHWKVHRKECRRLKKELAKRGGKLDLGNELDLGPLPDPTPREECPICMRALPLHEGLHRYFVCCKKMICCGCDLQHDRKTKGPRACAFCREPVSKSDEETVARLRKRVEGNDPFAMFTLALDYGFGELGLPVDEAKCIGLLRQSADLGSPPAQYQLGSFYDLGALGLERNEEEALNLWKEAAEGGNLVARHNLGNIEFRSENHRAAMRHWRLSASGGFKLSIDRLLIKYFEEGLLHHGDLAETLQAFYLARAEMKSENRDQYIVHLKMIGEYREEYEC